MEKILPFSNIPIVVKAKSFTPTAEKRIKAIIGASVLWAKKLIIPHKTLYTYLLDSIWILL